MSNLPVALATVSWTDLRDPEGREHSDHIVVHEDDYIDAVLDELYEFAEDGGDALEVTVHVGWYVLGDDPVGTRAYWRRVTLGLHLYSQQFDFTGVDGTNQFRVMGQGYRG